MTIEQRWVNWFSRLDALIYLCIIIYYYITMAVPAGQLAGTKWFAGSLTRTSTFAGMRTLSGATPSSVKHVICNCVIYIDDNGIITWRKVDAKHDFEAGLGSKVADKLLRTNYKIGEGNMYMEGGGGMLVIASTSSLANSTLHNVLRFSNIPIKYNQRQIFIKYDSQRGLLPSRDFSYFAPTRLADVNLSNLQNEIPILTSHPAGDVAVDIIINDRSDIDRIGVLGQTQTHIENIKKLKKYLGLNTPEPKYYAKDVSSALPENVFAALFNEARGSSYFSHILDPARNSKTVIEENGTITLFFCIANDKRVNITLKREWNSNILYYKFHTDPAAPSGRYHSYTFKDNIAPGIDCAVQYITKNISKKWATGFLKSVSNAASRVVTGNLDKGCPKFSTFVPFYDDFLDNFYIDIPIPRTPDTSKIVVISFKTIGDQSYLYDAALVADDPRSVTGDTFLEDYITYTKSSDVYCPKSLPSKGHSARKLSVYLKPRETDPEAIEAASKAATEFYKEEIDSYKENISKTRQSFEETMTAVVEMIKNKKLLFANYFKNIRVEAHGRRFKLYPINDDNKQPIQIANLLEISNSNAMINYYIAIELALMVKKIDAVKLKWLAINLDGLSRIELARTDLMMVKINEELIGYKTYLDALTKLTTGGEYNLHDTLNNTLNRLKEEYSDVDTKGLLPYKVLTDYRLNEALIRVVVSDNLAPPLLNGGAGKRGREEETRYVSPWTQTQTQTQTMTQTQMTRTDTDTYSRFYKSDGDLKLGHGNLLKNLAEVYDAIEAYIAYTEVNKHIYFKNMEKTYDNILNGSAFDVPYFHGPLLDLYKLLKLEFNAYQAEYEAFERNGFVPYQGFGNRLGSGSNVSVFSRLVPEHPDVPDDGNTTKRKRSSGGRKSKKRIHHLKINPSVKNKRRSNKKKPTRQKSRHNYTLKVNRYRKKN